MAKAKTVKNYKWEYSARGSVVVCHDNSFHKNGDVQAMCSDSEVAQCFVDILNESRKPENIL